jgi:uncharacterized protein YdaL
LVGDFALNRLGFVHKAKTVVLALALGGLLTQSVAMGQSLKGAGADQTVRLMSDFRALPKPPSCRAKRVLVLFDTTGDWGHLGELYALFTANLAGRWADYDAMPIAAYKPGAVGEHDLTVYIGSSYGEALPAAFTHDVTTSERPVLWLGYGIDDLAKAAPGFTQRYGFKPGLLDHGRFDRVDYHHVDFTRRGDLAGEIGTVDIVEPGRVAVLATAERKDGVRRDWAIRSGNLTYVVENPYAYMGPTDRYLVLADLITNLLAPNAPDTHRALVRIEDVGPDAKPWMLRQIADYLHARHVPFSVAVYDTFADPLKDDDSLPRRRTLAQAPQVVAALKYMVARGGTLIMHGHTHQLDSLKNPYTGKSADDFEFYRAHVDAKNQVRYDGPAPQDSRAWALGRIDAGLAEWSAAGLARPTIFEFPHYGASALDYTAVASRFSARYEQSMYYTGTLVPVSADKMAYADQMFPYPVRDIYGQIVVPEDMGNDTPYAYNQHASRSPSQLLDAATRDMVLKDGYASFFHHWFLGVGPLRKIVEPMQARGWTFVGADSAVAEASCR